VSKGTKEAFPKVFMRSLFFRLVMKVRLMSVNFFRLMSSM
jgi:hypothetical protein